MCVCAHVRVLAHGEGRGEHIFGETYKLLCKGRHVMLNLEHMSVQRRADMDEKKVPSPNKGQGRGCSLGSIGQTQTGGTHKEV
eukprot:1157114-Pelagomonas_calceolata.AAC.6